MKFVLVPLILCFACASEAKDNPLLTLIRHEVHALLVQDINLTVDACTTKCDALFDLIAGHDEQTTDAMCHSVCICQIHPTSCHNHHTTHKPHQQTTHKPHHQTTHKPHHTHAPRTTTPTPA